MERTPLVGRDAELAALLETVVGSGDPCVVLTAGPGMGKTSVMRELLARARELPVTVLAASPTELEQSLGFSALADLLGPLDSSFFDTLPLPQRTAVRAALLIETSTEEVDPRAVAVGVRGLLSHLAAERPVVLVIDDAHWLDAATAQALGHALRRTTEMPVRVVAAGRPGGRSVDDWLPGLPEERTYVALQPMDVEDLGAVIRRVVGKALDRSAVASVARAAGGNPLFAIEVARQRPGTSASGGGTVEELVSRRLLELPRPGRLGLLTAAVAGTPTVEVVAAALGQAPAELLDALEPAVVAGLVSVRDAIAFAHPVYASAVVALASDTDVRAAHAALIDIDGGEEVRARHRGLCCVGVDAQLSRHLDGVARKARDRGAWDSAVELMLLALAHTAPGEAHHERAATLGVWLARLGRPDAAEPWLREAYDSGTKDAGRAGLELLRVALLTGQQSDVEKLVAELTGPDVPPEVSAEAMILDLDRRTGLPSEAVAARLRGVNARLRELEPDAAVLRVRAKGLLMEADELSSNHQEWRRLVDQAREIEEVASPSLVGDRADAWLAFAAIIADRHDEARALLHDLISMSEQIGDDISLPSLLMELCWLETRAGRWAVADELAREALATASGQHQHWEQQAAVNLAETSGLRGETDTALAELDRLYEEVAHPLSPYPLASWWATRGQVLLAGGRIEEAGQAYTRAITESEVLGWEVPGVLQEEAPFMECAIACGRLEEASARLPLVIERAIRWDNPSVLDDCLRIEVLLTAAQGDLAAATALIPRMLGAHESGVGPLQRAHAHLTAGRVYRRAKAKTLAHDSLQGALRIYDDLGAHGFAEQARAELGRVGLRPRASDELTDTERQVVEHAVAGLRNRDIADRMFLSVKTVEAVLGRAYRKLGIRSRAELARAVGSQSVHH